NYATDQQILCVSSAGNNGSNIPVYPAALSNVVAVGSTGYTDQRSSFSNYGSFVALAAPGEAIVSTYPNGTYAAGWGTSFSTPFVSGAAALLYDLKPGLTPAQARTALSNAQPTGGGMGAGRLDVLRAIGSVRP
ncbi:MAG: S8 family serine peptidase, partial [Bryobacteraceae bacterium]